MDSSRPGKGDGKRPPVHTAPLRGALPGGRAMGESPTLAFEESEATIPGPGPQTLIGRTLGKNYRVIEPIGAGGMGIVYLVEHLTLKKRFAAKVLSADLASNPEAIARFEVEAHAASKLEHDNIVNVIDYGKSDDGAVFLVMELLRGKTLQARMDQGELTLEEIVGVTVQVCQALSCAHTAGIVHRDMKPDNIFLTHRDRGKPVVKVLDFGISKARESTLGEGRITKQGQVLGSPEYMSPEASRGDEVDARADIYAVGIMLYELMCGRVPFRHENYLKVLQMHVSTPPPAPRTLRPELPVEVEALILRALAKNPNQRQQSIDELETELMAALPDVAARALVPIHTPPHGTWLRTPPSGVAGLTPSQLSGLTPSQLSAVTKATPVPAPAPAVPTTGDVVTTRIRATADTQPAPGTMDPEIAAAPAVLARETRAAPRRRTALFVALGAALLIGGGVALMAARGGDEDAP
ncbi:MAG TPA: serine/threonine-protein kinase, partial [Kofleriaceae bacterium]|nr:serine/threonine-protein kinase [Kofleriaceae bacterium]